MPEPLFRLLLQENDGTWFESRMTRGSPGKPLSFIMDGIREGGYDGTPMKFKRVGETAQ